MGAAPPSRRVLGDRCGSFAGELRHCTKGSTLPRWRGFRLFVFRLASRFRSLLSGFIHPVVVVLCVLTAERCRAEITYPTSDYVQQIWKTEDGLPHSVVNELCQDRTGFIWLATAGGLARFDGREFKSYPLPLLAQTGGLNIRGVAQETENSLVVLTAANQVMRLEGQTFSVHPITALLAGKTPMELFCEPDGAVWVGSAEGFLARWKNGRGVIFGKEDGIDRRAPRFSFARDTEGRTWVASGSFLGYYAEGKLIKSESIKSRVITIASSQAGGLWVVAGGRLYRLKDNQIISVLENPPWIEAEASVRCAREDQAGALWISATHQGLYRWFDGHLSQVTYAYDTVHSILEDREGNIWAATEGEGLSVVKPKVFVSYNHRTKLKEKVTSSICEDAAGDMWFANRKGGLVQKHGAEIIHPVGKWEDINVNAVCPDLRGNLWIGADDGVYLRSNDDPSLPQKQDGLIRPARILFCTRSGEIWVAGNRTELGYYRDNTFHPVTPKEGFGREHFNAIAEDNERQVWIGAASGKLYRYAKGELVALNPEKGGAPVPIHSLFVDRSNTLWIGTVNGLLVRQGDDFKRLTEADGMADSMIFQIQEDDHGHLWFGSRRGLFYVSTEQLHLRVVKNGPPVTSWTFGKDEGLPGILPLATTQPSVWKDRSGSLWFATHQGVISLDPAALPKPLEPPPALIDEVMLDGKHIGRPTQLEIPRGRHHLEFRFTAIAYAAPSKVKLRHRLEGLDLDWIDSTNARSASYSSLSPGRYRLRLTACNESGEWNPKETILPLVVQPEWWQTSWFRIVAVCTAVALVAGVVRYWSEYKMRRRLAQLEREHALEKERTRIARDVHDELGGSVTGVRFLVNRLKQESLEPNRRQMIEQLSGQTQRLAFDLERVVWAVSPKNASLDRLGLFLGKFAQNFLRGSAVKCTVMREKDIPPLLINPDVQHHVLAVTKEALNNVLKHSEATEVVLELGFDQQFKLSICDNGIGFNVDAPENAERNGLGNMRSRVSELGGLLTIDSLAGKGTCVHLAVPINPQGKSNQS